MSPLLAVLIIVGIVFLLLISIQLLMAIFTSFRSWKFSSILLLAMLASVLFLINLYAQAILTPGIEERVREEVTAELQQEYEENKQTNSDIAESTEGEKSPNPSPRETTSASPYEEEDGEVGQGNSKDQNCNGILDGLESEIDQRDKSLCGK